MVSFKVSSGSIAPILGFIDSIGAILVSSAPKSDPNDQRSVFEMDASADVRLFFSLVLPSKLKFLSLLTGAWAVLLRALFDWLESSFGESCELYPCCSTNLDFRCRKRCEESLFDGSFRPPSWVISAGADSIPLED